MSQPKNEPQTVTQNQTSAPWTEQQPFLKYGFQEAKNLYQDPTRLQFYPNQTFAPFSPETETALAGTTSRALAGSPVQGAANEEVLKSLRGGYLDPASNPAWGSMVDTIKANVLPGIDSRFIAGGRSGSGLHGRAVGEGLGSAIGGLAYQNYGDERSRMAAYAGMAPQFAAADYADADKLAQVGAAREGMDQAAIDEAKARFDFSQTAPYNELDAYMKMIQGNYGGTSTGTTTQYLPRSSPFATALGGALGGTSLLGMTGAFGPAGYLTSLLR